MALESADESCVLSISVRSFGVQAAVGAIQECHPAAGFDSTRAFIHEYSVGKSLPD
jgi:hypothetical protein